MAQRQAGGEKMTRIEAAAAVLLLAGWMLLGGEVSTVSPPQASDMLKNPSTYLVDVRSIAEYYLVGHPVQAFNIPLTFWSETRQSFEPNENFVPDLLERFKTSDVLIFICRSGGRSLKAAEEAQKAGFKEVYSVDEGFEGEKDEKGLRTVGGWKNRGLPYTYEINPDLTYRAAKGKGSPQ
jgi:rhodanese-related sulfurtransferase